ncbi:heme exporter protein CcmD [Devosia sp. A449]
MIDLGPHAAFIIWAYLGVAIAVAGLIAWTLYDASSTDKKLTRLEASNPRRRPAK